MTKLYLNNKDSYIIILFDRDSIRSNEDEIAEYLVTASVDESVKVWELRDGALKLKHKLTGYFLGVVSIAISSDGSSKQIDILV